MALTVTGFSNTSLNYKLASETNAGVTPSTDIFGGAGTLHSIFVDNQNTSNAAYLKIKLIAGTVTVGTTKPDMMFHLAAAASTSHADRSVTQISFPAGIRFNQLSFWVTDQPAWDDSAGDPGTVVLSFLAS
jgi:hypothetical protein|tara:strand:+ start:1482 stop:1874 length:393 start_codon:yes stop_codon:yes gene_type:complete